MKDVTLLIAHPDDEALFCWPVLDRVKRIVCVADDLQNIERQFCRRRRYALEDVGKLLGAEIVCGDLNSEFYRLPARDGALKRALEAVMKNLAHLEGPLFTHNAWGEYGHLDHILCHHVGRTLQAQTGCELLCSDIAVIEHPAWLPIAPWKEGRALSGIQQQYGFLTLIPEKQFEIDRPLFDRIKAIYDARGCWTWAWEPVAACRVYGL